MDVRGIIKSQIVNALKDSQFPINTPEVLINAFPNGAETTCEAGDLKIKAGDAGKLLTVNDFPFETAENVGEIIVSRAGL